MKSMALEIIMWRSSWYRWWSVVLQLSVAEVVILFPRDLKIKWAKRKTKNAFKPLATRFFPLQTRRCVHFLLAVSISVQFNISKSHKNHVFQDSTNQHFLEPHLHKRLKHTEILPPPRDQISTSALPWQHWYRSNQTDLVDDSRMRKWWPTRVDPWNVGLSWCWVVLIHTLIYM